MSKQIEVLNAKLDNLDVSELLEQFESGILVTPNIDHFVRLQKEEAFYHYYENSDFVVCDSRIVFLLSRLLFPGKAIKAQITGSDFFPAFYMHHAGAGDVCSARIFLMGGTEESVVQAAQNINQKAGQEIVVDGYSPPFGFEKDAAQNESIITAINASNADTLVVGLGSPKQERWIFENREKLNHVKRFMALGATIEFESGNLSRAPKWMTKFALEWLYRLFQEPKRLAKRYLIEDIPFFYLILKQRLGLYKNPWSK